MIKSFADKTTKDLFDRRLVKKLHFENIKSAYRKLLIIDAADCIGDLRIPPGNKLEKLTGNLSGKYSIRINELWRIIFVWSDNNAFEVEIRDYH